jgi:predicted CoA-binding protein
MDFESDAFISYAHLDNVELIKGHKGWVTNLHRALEVRVAQLLGKQPQIWRDPKLKGNDNFGQTLVEKLAHVAVLISVVSPRYVKSDWALKELHAFAQAAQSHGGLSVEDKIRIFKVLKTPVPLEKHPPELQPVLGYEFFKIDPDSGRIRELNEIFGPEAQRDFWLKLDDLAHDICNLLEKLENPHESITSPASGQAVFLAETTSDLREQRETLRRDLQQHGYMVYPVRPLPCVASELRAAVAEDLEKCQLSVMLVGRNYSSVPEGCKDSQLEIQNQLAIEKAKHGGFSRLLWISPGLQVEDERQIQFIDRLRLDPRMMEGADLLETHFEEFRTEILDKLKRPPVAAPEAHPNAQIAAGTQHRSLYFIHDQRDADAASAWIGHLFDHFEVMQSVFEGDEAEIREYHDENLRNCDGVIIFYGTTNELWVRRKLREIQKSPGYGRTKPAPVVAIVMAPPRSAEKERFRTHDALVIPQFEGLAAEPLQEFIVNLKG